MPNAERYMRGLNRYLLTHNLRPIWANGLILLSKLPRIDPDVIKGDGPNRSVFKYDVKIADIGTLREEQDMKATIWIIENLDGTWTTEDWGEFYFKTKKDAMHFRLVWG